MLYLEESKEQLREGCKKWDTYHGCSVVGNIIYASDSNYRDGKYYASVILTNGQCYGKRFLNLAAARLYLENEVKEAGIGKGICKVKQLTSFSADGFYPTPEKVAGKMFKYVGWSRVSCILEPSAGKGDLLDACAKMIRKNANFYWCEHKNRMLPLVDIGESDWADCIEQDPNLSLILKGKGYHLVGDDFLSFHSFKHYDLILMNPPFANGDEHLWRAIQMQKKYGGQIVCLLNASTILNPYTSRLRETLIQELSDLNGTVEFVDDAFAHAERPTNVRIAIVYVDIPAPAMHSDILDGLQKAKEESELDDSAPTDIASANWMENMIQSFDNEAKVGIKLIHEFNCLSKYIMPGEKEPYSESDTLLQLTVGKVPASVNNYLKRLRRKYWNTLLNKKELTSMMTSDMQDQYSSKIVELIDYDFNLFNIKRVFAEIQVQLSHGIEDSIMKLFDRFSAQHAWYPECQKNIHYYNGWKTNKAHKVGMKVIIPANGCCADSWRHEKLDEYRVNSMISDLERAMNYLDRGETTSRVKVENMTRISNMRDSNKVSYTYFDITFYKKGTCHIKFHEDASRIIDRLNIFAGQRKAWLPPCYGKKRYEEMNEEEKVVIDEFQGRDSYEKVMADPGLYLTTSSNLQLLTC